MKINETITNRIIFGHKSKFRHPSMIKTISCKYLDLDIIDSNQASQSICLAKKQIKKYLNIVCIFNPKLNDRRIINELVDICKRKNITLITQKWIGGSLTNMKIVKIFNKKPDLIFSLSAYLDTIVLTEAKKVNIDTMAICDTNSDCSSVTFPIFGNDDIKDSLNQFIKVINYEI